MKKLFIILIAFAFGGAVVAQEKAKPIAKSANEESVKSDAGVKEEAAGEHHGEGVTHIKHNKYECPKCHMTSDKPGKCMHCKAEMIEQKAEMKKEKMEMKEEKQKEHHGEGDGHGHDKKPEEKK